MLRRKHYPKHQPSQILIKGDNRTVIDFMTHKGKFRRSDLQQLLEEAQHVLAFALPPVLWSYTPREFNRCADYLAGVARDHVKEHFAQSSPTLFGLLPFFFPLPPSLLSQFSSAPLLRIPASIPTLTLPEAPSLPMKLSSPLFRLYRQSPSVLRYLRATYSLRTSRFTTVPLHLTTGAVSIPHNWGPRSFLSRYDYSFLVPPIMNTPNSSPTRSLPSNNCANSCPLTWVHRLALFSGNDPRHPKIYLPTSLMLLSKKP